MSLFGVFREGVLLRVAATEKAADLARFDEALEELSRRPEPLSQEEVKRLAAEFTVERLA